MQPEHPLFCHADIVRFREVELRQRAKRLSFSRLSDCLPSDSMPCLVSYLAPLQASRPSFQRGGNFANGDTVWATAARARRLSESILP